MIMSKAQNRDEVIRQIEYFDKVKKYATKSKIWPEFGSPKYEADLVFFTAEKSYLIGRPILKTLKKKPLKTYRTQQIVVEETERLDTLAFHMETAYESQNKTQLWYHYPAILCSDYDTTRQYVEDVSTPQIWAAMVLHEYFHGFQFRHPEFIRFANDSITVSTRKLQSYYDKYPWFKKSVDEENQLLLECLNSNDVSQIKKLFKNYKAKRIERLSAFKEVEKFDLTIQEEFLEKMEGSARYMEYQLYQIFKDIPIDKKLAEIDNKYDFSGVKKFTLEDKPWMYQSTSIRYYYSTGFNMLRLLDQLKVSYKANFFDDNRSTPYELLNQKLSD